MVELLVESMVERKVIKKVSKMVVAMAYKLVGLTEVLSVGLMVFEMVVKKD